MTGKRWRGVLGYEGLPTTDGRSIRAGVLTWDVPLPLYANGGDQGVAVVGSILTVERIATPTGAVVLQGSGKYTGDAEPGTVLTIGIDVSVTDHDEQAATITAGALLGAHIGEAAAWPDAQITVLADP